MLHATVGGPRVLIVSIGAVVVAVVNLVNPDLGPIHAVEPVDRVTVLVVLLLVGSVLAVLCAVVHPIEGYLLSIAAEERNFLVTAVFV